MTLLNIIATVKERFPSADAKDICRLTNELEKQLISEIFSLNGIECRTASLDTKNDMNTPLLLEEDELSLYLYYIYSFLLLQESDYEASNTYSAFFNEKFSELAVFYRRNNLPTKKTLLRGGI